MTRLTAKGGVHFLDDCHLKPQELVAWLSAECERLGVDFQYSATVKGVVKENAGLKAVQTSAGDIEAEEFVLSAGSWSGQIAKQMSFRMPLQGGKGYSVDLPMSILPKHCFILVEGRVAVTPMAGRLRFAGTMEVVGDNLSINPGRYQGILNAIPKYMPDFSPIDFQDLGVWAGLRPCSADGLPYLGRPASVENLIVATGHSMMGVSLAPVTGKIVADLVSGIDPEFGLDVLKPDRFG